MIVYKQLSLPLPSLGGGPGGEDCNNLGGEVWGGRTGPISILTIETKIVLLSSYIH
jgi:hypothetical protein